MVKALLSHFFGAKAQQQKDTTRTRLKNMQNQPEIKPKNKQLNILKTKQKIKQEKQPSLIQLVEDLKGIQETSK